MRTLLSRPRLAHGLLLVALGMLPQSAPAATTPTATKSVEIRIDNFTFEPAEITIAPGTKVTWVNADDIPHQVAEKDLAFRSKALDTDDSFSRTFDAAGVIDYFCTLHPHMTGKIIVKDP